MSAMLQSVDWAEKTGPLKTRLDLCEDEKHCILKDRITWVRNYIIFNGMQLNLNAMDARHVLLKVLLESN